MRKITYALIISALSGIWSLPTAHAEKADKFQKTVVSGTSGGFDIAKNIRTIFNIELTRGTLFIRAEKGVDTEIPVDKDHPEGGGMTILTGTSNNPVFFKQKRDGGPDLWIEGIADRVEYDKATEIVKFYGNAKVRFLDHQKETSALVGDFFSYDSPNDYLDLGNSTTGKSVPKGGRVTFTIAPKIAKPESKADSKQEKQ